MANIVDPTYFEFGSLYIPNNKDINAEPIDTPTNQTGLEFFIDKYERQLLLNALGVTLYDELQTALLDLPGADQKWTNLVEGLTYVDTNGNTKIWDGLDGFDKQSVIAFYIFCEYLRNYNETYATTGVARNDAKNATNYDATPKYIKSHLQFINFYQGNRDNRNPNIVVNRNGNVGYDWYGTGNVQVSLYQYLLDANALDETAFPDFQFRFYQVLNSFGI